MKSTGPHPVVVAGVVGGYVVALWPGTLPRTPLVSGAFTTVVVVFGAAIGALVARRRPVQETTRRCAAVAGTVAVAGILIAAGWWQQLICDALDVPAPRLDWYCAVLVPPLGIVAGFAWALKTFTALSMSAAVALGLLTGAPAHAAPQVGIATNPVLVGALDPDDFSAGAHDLVARWIDSGGLHRRAVIIAVPTGSGWVDGTAVARLSELFGGDIAILTLPYSDLPSWRAFAGDRAAAGRSATALAHELALAVQRTGEPRQLEIILYGQSLGALGADEARRFFEDHHPGLLSGTVLVAPPAGTIAARSATPRSVVVNDSDPVPMWAVTALWRPPSTTAVTVRIGRRIPHAPWVPVLSFLQSSVDLLGALDSGAGIGHRYGVDQVILPVTATRVGQPIGPRADS